MVRQKVKDVGGGKKKTRRPRRDRKRTEGVEIKLEGQTVPDPAKRYRS